MPDVIAKAVVLGPASGTDSTYKFTVAEGFFKRPADEIVDVFMEHLHEVGALPDRNDYELNSAFKNKEKSVVTGLGALSFANEDMPFVVMIYSAA